MDADGFFLTLLTPPNESPPRDVMDVLRLAVRTSRGGVLAVGRHLAPGAASPVATVTRRLGDGRLVGATACFGPLDGETAEALAGWLHAGGPVIGRPPHELDEVRLTPLAVAAATASAN
jgi:hypothetical protein